MFFTDHSDNILSLFLSLPLSPSPLVWVPTETLGRALKSCQSVLEGGAEPVSNQNFFQSAVQTTFGVLDSILYLTSEVLYTHKNTHYSCCSYAHYSPLYYVRLCVYV